MARRLSNSSVIEACFAVSSGLEGKGRDFPLYMDGKLVSLAVKMSCRMQQGREIVPNLPPKEELSDTGTNSRAMTLQESNVWEGRS